MVDVCMDVCYVQIHYYFNLLVLMHGIAAYLMQFINAISAKDNVDIFESQTFNAKITLEAVCLQRKSSNTFENLVSISRGIVAMFVDLVKQQCRANCSGQLKGSWRSGGQDIDFVLAKGFQFDVCSWRQSFSLYIQKKNWFFPSQQS